MKLFRYRQETAPHASGGKDIMLENAEFGTARFEFPGVDGTYTLIIRYGDENDGNATYSVRVQDPEPSATDDTAAPEAPARPSAPQKPEAP